MLKKILSPIAYTVSLVPVFFAIMVMKTMVENMIDVLFGMNGSARVSILIIILILGTVLFWIANKLIAGLEKLPNPTSLDHFRHSIFYYLASLYILILLLGSGYHGGLGEAYVLIVLGISVWAIVINAIFLYRRRKANIS